MRTSAAGSEARPPHPRTKTRGFTLIELLVVVAIIAIGSAGVVFAVRDAAATQLDREALRLASLLEAGRAQSRATGQALRWRAVEGGFRFEGGTQSSLPGHWLSQDVQVLGTPVLVLGPEPLIGPQSVDLASATTPRRAVHIATDGLRPFTVHTQELP